MNKDLTQGNVLKILIMFAIPYLLSSFLQKFYGMADLYIIGQYQTSASISAVSIGSQFMNMLTVMIIGLAMGATVHIGQSVGCKDEKEVKKTIGNTALLFIGISFALSIVLIFSVSFIVQMMSTPQEAVFETNNYLRICFIGIPFICAYNVLSSIYRGLGDSQRPMYFIIISCFLNIILAFYFIGYLSMGAVGAALGTVISQAMSSIIALFYLFKKSSIHLQFTDFSIDYQTMRKILKVGIPIALQDGFIQISFLIITIIANSRGLIPATSVGLVEKIISFMFLVPSAMLSALSAMVAQNIGAKKYERAKAMLKYALFITLSFGMICCIVCQMIPHQLIGLFTHEQAVINMGAEYLKVYAFDCIFASVHFCFSGYFCGCGYSKISFIHNVISILLVRIPGAYLASLLFPNTLLPMGLAAPIGSLLSSLICIGYYIHMKKYRLVGD